MSEFKTVARPYAKAAFDFAVEKNDVDRWLNMLNFASEVVKMPQIHDLILSDAKPEIISKMIIDVCDEQLDEYGQNFVRILAENQRLTLLPVILYSFIEYHAMKESFVEVDVTSALALSEAQKMNITQSMEKRLSRKVKLDCKIDKSIVAGIIIRSGDMVIDGSIRGRLERLTDTLQS